MRKWYICFFVFVITACGTAPVVNKPVVTILSDNKVSFKGAIFTHDALMQLKQGTLSSEEWANVLPVMAADTDSETEPELQIMGEYIVSDTAVVFTAQKPFAKHVQYIARFYASDAGLSYLKLAQSKQNLKGPNQTEFSFKLN